MPTFDQVCTKCGWIGEITVAPHHNPPCPTCGGQTERIYLGGYQVVGDEFPGGKTFENLGHRPVTVHSKSELKRVMEMRGLEPKVRHIGTPGSDRSPHTSRWV
jgi:hypothetical protein